MPDVPAPSVRIERTQFAGVWDPGIPPVTTVDSGAVVEFDLLESSGGQLGPESTAADLETLDFGRVDQVHGPVAVRGAVSGDVLQIEFLEFTHGGWGWTANIPGFGLLADDFPNPAYRVTQLPPLRGRAEFLHGIRIPIQPFCGVVGVAPSAGPLPTVPPGHHGGNMDTRHLTAGSSLFLPVFVPGALVSLGDGHAAQGDGEVCGTAIETPMSALVRVTLRKDMRLSGPEFMTTSPVVSDRAYATDGIGPDLLAAARDATRRMIDWLVREHHLSAIDAYLLCSVAVDLRISEIVDLPNFVVTAHCPLSIFQ